MKKRKLRRVLAAAQARVADLERFSRLRGVFVGVDRVTIFFSGAGVIDVPLDGKHKVSLAHLCLNTLDNPSDWDMEADLPALIPIDGT